MTFFEYKRFKWNTFNNNTFYVWIDFEKDLNKIRQYNIMSTYKYMGQNQATTSKQSQLVDQNYANGTFFMAMSTLEQIERAAEGLNKGPKEFGKYDHYDYAWKDYQQLKNQLKTQISLVHISIVEFDKLYQNAFSLPKNYDLERVMKRLEESKTFLREDKDMVYMCTDLQNLVKKQY